MCRERRIAIHAAEYRSRALNWITDNAVITAEQRTNERKLHR
jgi:hypothetical protein